jgi:hypothetical protein
VDAAPPLPEQQHGLLDGVLRVLLAHLLLDQGGDQPDEVLPEERAELVLAVRHVMTISFVASPPAAVSPVSRFLTSQLMSHQSEAQRSANVQSGAG